MLDKLIKFLKDEEGASAVEYALIVGLMAAIIVGAFVVFGDAITDLFDAVVERLGTAEDEI